MPLTFRLRSVYVPLLAICLPVTVWLSLSACLPVTCQYMRSTEAFQCARSTICVPVCAFHHGCATVRIPMCAFHCVPCNVCAPLHAFHWARSPIARNACVPLCARRKQSNVRIRRRAFHDKVWTWCVPLLCVPQTAFQYMCSTMRAFHQTSLQCARSTAHASKNALHDISQNIETTNNTYHHKEKQHM